MKKLNILGSAVILAISAFTSAHAQAADRCDGLVAGSLITAESVADMYFDMRVAELQCHYVSKDQTLLNKISATIGKFEMKYSSCIKGSQDQMVAYLGSEGTFDNFYATVGNQIVLLNLTNPCGRALSLSQAMLKKPMTCGAQMATAYAPWFAQLDNGYAQLTHKTFHRICDKTDE